MYGGGEAPVEDNGTLVTFGDRLEVPVAAMDGSVEKRSAIMNISYV